MNAPLEIALDRRAHRLVLVWENGERQPLDAAQLRRACPCAACRRLRRLGGQIVAPPLTELDIVQPMGYGVQIGFNDGHARGIYPWPYLARLPAFADTP